MNTTGKVSVCCHRLVMDFLNQVCDLGLTVKTLTCRQSVQVSIVLYVDKSQVNLRLFLRSEILLMCLKPVCVWVRALVCACVCVCVPKLDWEPGWLVDESAGLVIERFRVRIPAGAAEEFSS